MWTDSSGGTWEQAPTGSHPARCVRIIDIGTQQGEWMGKPKYQRQVILGWELPTELMTQGEFAGQPFMLSKFYTMGLGEKYNLRADLVSWRGRDFTPEELAGFDPRKILGTGCMLSVILSDKKKAKVSGVMALPRGMILPKQVNPSIYFSLDPQEYDPHVFEKLSDGYKRMIQASPEWAELHQKPMSQADADAMNPPYGDDDVPF